MELYCRMKNYDKVLELLEKYSAGEICEPTIYYYAADANRHIGNYEKAIALYKKSGDMGVYFHSEIEGIADCYNVMGEKQLAYEKYMEMASFYKKEGYDEEALFYEDLPFGVC